MNRCLAIALCVSGVLLMSSTEVSAQLTAAKDLTRSVQAIGSPASARLSRSWSSMTGRTSEDTMPQPISSSHEHAAKFAAALS